jgi:long-chain acyl-CoA synthetase
LQGHFQKVHDELGGNIKAFISGGAKLDEKIIRDFRALGILMLEGYGLTESSPMVTYHPFDRISAGSVGRVFDEIDIKFEEDGEILIKGPTITPGYWNKADDTAAAFTPDGYFHTGDLGRMDKRGYLYLTGRKKDLIILSNGKNVRPDLIEAKIKNSSPLIQDIAVAHYKNSLVALVVPDTAAARRQKISNITEAIKFDVIDEYNKSVENYKKIHDIIISTDDLPRTRMGKLKRYQLDGYIAAQGRKKKAKASGPKPSYEEYRIIEKYIAGQAGVPYFRRPHRAGPGLDSLEIVELRVFMKRVSA